MRAKYAALLRSRSVEAAKARRVRYYQTRYFLAYPTAVSYAAADLVRRVHDLVPPLRLADIRMDPGLHDLNFELTVEVAATSPESARRRFSVFFDRIEKLAGVFEASFSPGGLRNGRFIFTARGRVELP